MKTEKMNAIVATGYGAPEVLKYREVDIPMPGEHEILIKVMVSSVTRADTMKAVCKPSLTGSFRWKKWNRRMPMLKRDIKREM